MYQDVDVRGRHVDTFVSPGESDDDADDEAAYWAFGPCPVTDYRARTGDLRALRMSDLISARSYHELPIFREYFAPGGVDHMIDLGLPTQAGRHRSFLLFREHGSPDFSERDRAVLETLRPHLQGLEARATLRRRLAAGREDGSRDPVTADRADRHAKLTVREQEIVDLVGRGLTNAQIAAELWVAPSTVKKHLENVYEKLGVSRRTAAVTLVHAVQ